MSRDRSASRRLWARALVRKILREPTAPSALATDSGRSPVEAVRAATRRSRSSAFWRSWVMRSVRGDGVIEGNPARSTDVAGARVGEA